VPNLITNNKYLFLKKFPKITTKRFYSTSSTDNLPIVNPIPILVINNLLVLDDKHYVNSYKEIIKNKAGIYSFINTINGNQYIGSAKDLYLRLNEHLNNRKSNSSLQKAFEKYGLDKFN
jgi:hypothetical protein